MRLRNNRGKIFIILFGLFYDFIYEIFSRILTDVHTLWIIQEFRVASKITIKNSRLAIFGENLYSIVQTSISGVRHNQ